MAANLTTQNTVLGVLLPKEGSVRLLAKLATVVLGTVLLTLSAKISVPVLPVPVTLQTFAVAALAAGFGWRIAVATVSLYLVQGLAGLPVFATGGGLDYVFRPSFGFLLGLVPMAFIIGRVADAGFSGRPVRMFLAMLAADAVAFAFGFAWLLVVVNLVVSQGGAMPGWLDAANLVGSAFDGAVKPFVLWDVVKMAFAAATVGTVWTLLRKKA